MVSTLRALLQVFGGEWSSDGAIQVSFNATISACGKWRAWETAMEVLAEIDRLLHSLAWIALSGT